MSQMADLIDTFKDLKDKYNWSQEETIDNLYRVTSDLEWSYILDRDIPKDSCGDIDYDLLELAERTVIRDWLEFNTKTV